MLGEGVMIYLDEGGRMMRRVFVAMLAVVLVTLLLPPVFAGTVAISGTVFSADGNPVAGAEVGLFAAADTWFTNPLSTAATGPDGAYSLNTPELAVRTTYAIRAAKADYYPQVLMLTLNPGAAPVAGYDLWLETAQTVPVEIDIDLDDRKPVQLLVGFNNMAGRFYYPFNEPGFADAMIESGATVSRFPAGTLGNYYDFQTDTFLDAPLRWPKEYYFLRSSYASDADYVNAVNKANLSGFLNNWLDIITKCKQRRGTYGFEEFQDLIAKMNAKAVYMGNISTAPDGRDPVDYLTESMRSLKDRGKTLDLLELGNELFTYGDQSRFNGFFHRPRVFAETERAARQIKEVFPRIKIGVFGAWNGARTWADGVFREGFNAELAGAVASDCYDAVDIHSYLRMSTMQDAAAGKQTYYDPQIIAARMLAATQTMPSRLYRQWKDTFPGKEIWMSETGFTTDAPGSASELATGVLFTLVEMDYLLHWLEYDDIVKMYVKHVALTEVLNDNTVLFYKNSDTSAKPDLIKTPTYYGFATICNALKDSAYRLGVTTANNPTFRARPGVNGSDCGNVIKEGVYDGNGVPVAFDYVNVEELTARALLAKDGKTIYVPFVNKRSAPLAVRLNPGGISLAGKMALITSISGNLKDRNDVQNPDRVIPVKTYQAADGVIQLPPYATGVIAVPITDGNASLAGLGVSKGKLNPVFNPATTAYTVEVGHNDDLISLTPMLADAEASIRINGASAANNAASAPFALAPGPNRLTIVTTAADGVTSKTYTVTVNRFAVSNDATLKDLQVRSRTVPDFAPDRAEYSVTLPYAAAMPAITAVPADVNAQVVVYKPAGLPGTANVKVTAEDGLTTRTYSIALAKSPPGADATLNNLYILNEYRTIAGFDPAVKVYNIEVPYGTTIAPKVAGSAADRNAVVAITPPAYPPGAATNLPGTTTIVVTAADGVTKNTYTVHFTVAPPNHDATLSDLTVGGETVAGFASATTDYTVEVPYDLAQIPAIAAVASYPKASVTVIQAAALPGTAEVRVTAEDGVTSQVYRVNFTVVDRIPPVTTASLEGTKANGWFNGHVMVTLSASDEYSAVTRSQYGFDGTGWIDYTGPFTVSGSGHRYLQFFSIDAAGNSEPVRTIEIPIDQTAPLLAVEVNGAPLLEGASFEDWQALCFQLSATDALSGVAGTGLTVDGAACAAGDSIVFAGKLGEHQLVASTVDKAGNQTIVWLSFRIVTSLDSLRRLLAGFVASGELSEPSLVAQLTNSLDQVRHQLDKGRYEQAGKHLEDFLKHLDKKGSEVAETVVAVLSTDAHALLTLYAAM